MMLIEDLLQELEKINSWKEDVKILRGILVLPTNQALILLSLWVACNLWWERGDHYNYKYETYQLIMGKFEKAMSWFLGEVVRSGK